MSSGNNSQGEVRLISNFHSHSRFCDGVGEPEEYVQAAIRAGMQVFGFSSHAPLCFETDWTMGLKDLPEYLRVTQSLREAYADRIELITGLETDWYPGCTDWRNTPGVFYTLGSVHFLPHPDVGIAMPVDSDQKTFRNALEDGFEGDIRAFGRAYFSAVRDMLAGMCPDILAHLDVFRKNNAGNRFFHEEAGWYRDEILKTLKAALLSGVIVEVNTGGMSRGYLDSPYPDWWALEAIREMNIPIMLNSDTHHPGTVDFGFTEVLPGLRRIGFTHQRILTKGAWQDVLL